MNEDEALAIADRATGPAALDSPPLTLMSMLRALEILADGHRCYKEKAEAWRASSERMAQRATDANEELDRTQEHWSDLMYFIRTTLNLDVRALDDVAEVRKILGRALTDARLLRRIRDEVNGHFMAAVQKTTDEVKGTADAVNAVKAARETNTGTAETLTVRPDAGESVKINHGGYVYIAPEGTDPKDTAKWTRLGTMPRGWVLVEPRKQTPTVAAPRKFAPGSPEPGGVKRVGRVSDPDVTFTRIGSLPNGHGVWRRDGEAWLLEWAHLVKFVSAVEIL